MFSAITPLSPRRCRVSFAATAKSNPVRRICQPLSVSEAYELRLLGEVARWDDQAAFEEIYRRHLAAVTHAAWQICRDADMAEDIAQKTFTALWFRAGRLVARAVRLRPWLMIVARNAATDSVIAANDSVAIDAAAQLASSVSLVEDRAAASEVRDDLATALATLAPALRAAVELVYFEGLTYESAADAIGETAAQVESYAQLAVDHLRRCLTSAR